METINSVDVEDLLENKIVFFSSLFFVLFRGVFLFHFFVCVRVKIIWISSPTAYDDGPKK